MGKSYPVQILAEDETTESSAQVCRLADKEIHADAIVDSDDGGPIRVVDIAVALEVSERSASTHREVADVRRRSSDEWSVLGGNVVQRDGRLLVKLLDVRLSQPGRESRKVRQADRAKADAFRWVAARRRFLFLNTTILGASTSNRKKNFWQSMKWLPP
jgi:hypothetical protein